MERAARKCVDWIVNKYDESTHFTVFCGLGNNGGDGLVIARILLAKGYRVIVYVVKYSANSSEDFNENYEGIKNITTVRTIVSEKHIPAIEKNSVLIDALFGSGINRSLESVCKLLIKKINSSTNTKIAIDVPSGLGCELNDFSLESVILEASYTLTFETPKLPFLLPDTAKYVGIWKVLPIDLSDDYKLDIETPYEYINLKNIKKILKPRAKFSHKGTYGHAEIIGGAYGKIGAIVLASKACLKSGVGLLIAYTPNCGLHIMQSSVPEAMWSGNQASDQVLEGNYTNTHKTIGIGPGLGIDSKTQLFLQLVLKSTETPMVIDADAINILAKNKDWLHYIPKNSILTPHPKEFKRLVGNFKNDIEKLQKLKEFSETYSCYVILKGAYTAIANPNGQVYFNSTGNPGMATAGSGDVLTGVITALLAQGYTPKNASILGVYIHGLAGDIAIKKISMQALTAGDIIKHLGKAFLKIEKCMAY